MAFHFLKRIREFRSEAVTEFYSHIDTLLENEMVQQLDAYIQHYCYTRLKHSLDVAYYSFMVTKLLHWDSRSAARAGLMHDLFLYDWREESGEGGNHAFRHPLIALENAKKICSDLNAVEEDIIKKHMWLITPIPPRYKEGFVVTFVDKICATKEFFTSVFSRAEVRAVYVTHA